jgi:aldehyde dehydrogenase
LASALNLHLEERGTIMTTVTQPRTYVQPGFPDSVVTVKSRYDNFTGGRWVPPVSGQYTQTLSPATGQPFTQVPRSTPEDVEVALDAAHAAKEAWGETAPAEPPPRREPGK